jgi:hypothetical protein
MLKFSEMLYNLESSLYSSVDVLTRLRVGQPTIHGSIPVMNKIFFSSQMRPSGTWGPQPPILYLSEYLSPAVKRLTTDLHVVSRSRMIGAILPVRHMSSWRAKGKLRLYLRCCNDSSADFGFLTNYALLVCNRGRNRTALLRTRVVGGDSMTNRRPSEDNLKSTTNRRDVGR